MRWRMVSYVIAVFSIRSSTMEFSLLLKNNGIRNSVIETPKAISASCGVCVKISENDVFKAKQVLKVYGVKNFVNFYIVNSSFGRFMLRPYRF